MAIIFFASLSLGLGQIDDLRASRNAVLDKEHYEMGESAERVFADHAEELRRAGFAVLPAEGKKPLVRRFNSMRYPLSAASVAKLGSQHPSASIAIVPGLSKARRHGGSIIIVDADNEKADQRAAEIFGETPGQVQTRRGRHRFYSLAEDEAVGITNLRRYGLAIDLKHGRSIAIAPPSRHADDPSFAYAWIGCDPTVIDDLPPFNLSALRHLTSQESVLRPNVTEPPPPALSALPLTAFRQFRDGSRGQGLNDTLVRMAWFFNTFNDMIDYARTWNADLPRYCLEPMDDADVLRRAIAVWRDREADKIERWQGQRAVANVRADETRHLSAASRPGANALTLLALLRAEHGARAARCETFAISINAMVRDRVLGHWSVRRLRNARNELLVLGYIRRVSVGSLTTSGRTADQYALVPWAPRDWGNKPD